MRIFLERRPAPRRIRNDRVELLHRKRLKVRCARVARHVANSRVIRKRAAANLPGRHHHLAAIRLQHADRRAIQFAERHLCHAPGKQRHARAPRSLRRKRLAQLREEKFRIDPRQQPFALLQPQKPQNAGTPSQLCQSRTLIEFQKSRRRGDPRGIRKQPPVHKIARQPRSERPLVVLFDLRARCFHQPAVFHAGRARRLASAAVQAPVDMRHEGLAQLQLPFVHEFHLPDPPAWRIRLPSPQPVRRTLVEANPQ